MLNLLLIFVYNTADHLQICNISCGYILVCMRRYSRTAHDIGIEFCERASVISKPKINFMRWRWTMIVIVHSGNHDMGGVTEKQRKKNQRWSTKAKAPMRRNNPDGIEFYWSCQPLPLVISSIPSHLYARTLHTQLHVCLIGRGQNEK